VRREQRLNACYDGPSGPDCSGLEVRARSILPCASWRAALPLKIDLPKGRFAMAKAPDADGYIKLVRGLQAKCADLSWTRAPKLGERAPVLINALDVLLSYLDRAATCFGGCRGGDHRAEFLTGRAVSSCQACLLLMTSGYYDEALSIIRSLGEIANLMAMFVADISEFERWRNLTEKDRRRYFTPVKVRLWLEERSAPMVIDEKRCGILSAYSIHAGPDAMPQAHNEHGRAIVAPLY
jgi:hypothetical protein